MTIDYAGLIKTLRLPPGFTAPTRLTYEDLEARALTRADLQEDVRGIKASIELIQRTRGGGWPTGSVTEDFNFVDLVWHEQESREGTSFAYEKLYQALQRWVTEAFPFEAPHYSNREMPG